MPRYSEITTHLILHPRAQTKFLKDCLLPAAWSRIDIWTLPTCTTVFRLVVLIQYGLPSRQPRRASQWSPRVWPAQTVICPFCTVDYSFMEEDDSFEDDDDEDNLHPDGFSVRMLGSELRIGTGRAIPTKFDPPNTSDTPSCYSHIAPGSGPCHPHSGSFVEPTTTNFSSIRMVRVWTTAEQTQEPAVSLFTNLPRKPP